MLGFSGAPLRRFRTTARKLGGASAESRGQAAARLMESPLACMSHLT
jgi:hypothetical protein